MIRLCSNVWLHAKRLARRSYCEYSSERGTDIVSSNNWNEKLNILNNVCMFFFSVFFWYNAKLVRYTLRLCSSISKIGQKFCDPLENRCGYRNVKSLTFRQFRINEKNLSTSFVVVFKVHRNYMIRLIVLFEREWFHFWVGVCAILVDYELAN